MLPKTKRVKKSLFSTVFSSGRVFHSRYFTIRVSPSPDRTGSSKYSFVVSKAVAKSAVNRNLLRRRGYATISDLEESIPSGLTIVFFCKKGLEALKFKEISFEIKDILEKARIIYRK